MVLVTVYQDDVEATTISRTEPNTPSDASLRSIVAYAHRIGLNMSQAAARPAQRSDALARPDRPRLHRRRVDGLVCRLRRADRALRRARGRHALRAVQRRLRARLDVGHAAAWRQIVADVRAVYHGKITYADDQITIAPHAVSWWDAVDLIGQDRLSDSERPDASHGRPARGGLGTLRPSPAPAAALRQAVIFTKIGIRSIVGAARAPWDWQVWARSIWSARRAGTRRRSRPSPPATG